MVLALKDKWIWDFWLVDPGQSDDGKWHIYFLQADKSLIDPHLRHRNVTQAHAVSDDLVNWTHLGMCFAPAKEPAWDDWTTWTGSVVKDDGGLWHLFYTGTMHDLDGMHQRLGHATAKDMHSWERLDSGLVLDRTGLNAKFYEEYTPGKWHDRAMRDPWVMRDPDGDGWLMYFTCRIPGVDEPNAGGGIGFATSPDLYTWTLQPPTYAGGCFGQMEVPQVLEINGRWYCLFCTSSFQWSESYKKLNPQSPVTGTHYLMAENPRGPWTVAPGPFFDGALPCKRYTGKIIKKDGKLYTMGFLDTGPDGKFVGEVCDPIPVSVGADGLLKVEE